MTKSRGALLLLFCVLAACASHEKAGRRAAAVGDWKTAEREYAQALRDDPGKKELQDDHREARTKALEGALSQARACASGQDWECAFAESSYALSLDPASAEMVALRRDAGREVGFLRLRRADEAARGRDLPRALALLADARAATEDPGVAAEAHRLQPGIVGAAVADADRLRAARQFPQAIDLLAEAARVDPGVTPRLQAVQAEYEKWKDGEAERLVREGDDLLGERRFADAKTSYDAAVRLRPQGRGQPLSRYAGLLAQGDAAVAKRDFAAAERAFGEASQLPADRDRQVALVELDRVKVRPYAIRIRSVLVRPLRPDGYPWAGTRSRELDRVLARLARDAAPRGAVPPVGLTLDAARRLPRENLPSLIITVVLPDGRALQTAPRIGVHAALDGSFVVASNGYDDRAVSVRVVHDAGSGRPLEVGTVSVPLGDLVTNREIAVADGSVSELRLEADPADLPEGTYSGLTPLPGDGNLAPAWSMPRGAARGFRLAAIDAAPSPADLPPVAGQPAPELTVEVEQRGAVVFRSAPQSPRASPVTFRPGSTYLFVAPDETVTIRLWARTSAGTAAILSAPVNGRALERGTVDLASPKGSTLRLRLEPRRAGPGVVAAR
jgi:hypothetical protein